MGTMLREETAPTMPHMLKLQNGVFSQNWWDVSLADLKFQIKINAHMD
jgi:hypothetical protein